ncbi:MAG TPA: VWA domain-containing protein [Vicinamibacterales bacterium]|jgi:VWFA-related protein
MTGRTSLAVTALALQILGGRTIAQVQPPAFSTQREIVRVDVLVTDRGGPVAGLGPSDFEIFDNDVRQTVDLVSFEQIPLNVVLALDVSNSVSGERLEHLRAGGQSVTRGLTSGDQAALITFNQVVAQLAPLTHDVGRVRDALESTLEPGDTALIDGVYTAMIVGESDAGRGLVIVFSDGLDTISWLSPGAVLETAKRSDVVVYGVSIGNRTPFLRDLSTLTGGSVINIDSTKNLSATFARILDEFRHRYLVSYSPQGVTRGGWHRLTVRVRGRNLTVKARPGYLRDRS